MDKASSAIIKSVIFFAVVIEFTETAIRQKTDEH